MVIKNGVYQGKRYYQFKHDNDRTSGPRRFYDSKDKMARSRALSMAQKDSLALAYVYGYKEGEPDKKLCDPKYEPEITEKVIKKPSKTSYGGVVKPDKTVCPPINDTSQYIEKDKGSSSKGKEPQKKKPKKYVLVESSDSSESDTDTQ